MPRGVSTTAVTMETLEPRLLLSGGVLITEFMAANDETLADQDGDCPDWLELYNAGEAPVDLDGWFLTDDADLLDLWRLPAITLAPGEYRVIFASDKDRRDPAGELHTDFKISASGEYLGLIRPDGVTVEHAYAPAFPAQDDDISYGLAFDSTATETLNLVTRFDAAKAVVPDAATPPTWFARAFDAAAWDDAVAAIGYERQPDDDTSYTGYFGTDLETAMYDVNPSAYLRIPFTVDDPTELLSLTLHLRYDDGFLAFLNGAALAGDNYPTPTTYDAPATASRPDSLALAATEFDLTGGLSRLTAGENVLAVQGFNRSADSSDFLIAAELTAERAAAVTQQEAWFITPTPGAENTAGVLGVVDDTAFSVDRGFFTDPLDVAVTTDTDGAEIRYTTDGSTPTATHGTVYTGPVHITGQTVLRAAAFKPDWQPSNVDTQTYLFLGDGLTQPDWPAGYPTEWNGDNYTRPADYGMDPEIVNDPAYADEMIAAMTSIPTVSIVTDIDNLFDPTTGIYIKATREGMAYERPASFEYFDADGNARFQIDCGLRMRGGASRNQRTTPKHSFRLIFRGQYGAGKLEYPLFGEDATDSFDTIILRAGSNLSWPHHNGWPVYSENRLHAQYVRDQWAKATQRAMDGYATHNHYAHLYVNGIYWGLYNPGERPSAPFAADYLGGDKDDYDAINSGKAIDGDTTAWYDMLTLGNQGLDDPARYQQMTEMLDVRSFADYMIINQYGGNFDWDHHNWHAFRNRNGGKWYFSIWDTEIIFIRLYDNRIDPSRFGQYEPSSSYDPEKNTLTRLWLQLMDNEEFRVLFADRIHKHLFNGGLLTPDSVIDRWTAISDQVYLPILGESARWGDYRRDVYYAGRASFDDRRLYDRDEEWINERRRLLNDYFPQRTNVVIQQYQTFGAYGDMDGPLLLINGVHQHGGVIAPGDALTLTAPDGVIVYTTDGGDPRLPGGEINPDASFFVAGSPVPLTADTVVKARTYHYGEWSPLSEAIYETADGPPLAVTEINYHPPAPTDDERAAGFDDNNDFEFIELHNTASAPLDIRTVSLAVAIRFDFDDAAIATLEADGYVLLVRNRDAFEMRYGTGLPVAGEYLGKLDNAGETLVLRHGSGSEVLRFTYDDDGDWPAAADGDGFTLELIDPDGDYNDPANWRASAAYLGTPGVGPTGSSADFDADGDVDLDDFVILKTHFGRTGDATPATGDADGDRDVDLDDFVVFKQAFGAAAAVDVTVDATAEPLVRRPRPVRRLRSRARRSDDDLIDLLCGPALL
ncbi:MAG: lamin tail domain-containing protein [Planctomycetota bacterium]